MPKELSQEKAVERAMYIREKLNPISAIFDLYHLPIVEFDGNNSPLDSRPIWREICKGAKRAGLNVIVKPMGDALAGWDIVDGKPTIIINEHVPNWYKPMLLSREISLFIITEDIETQGLNFKEMIDLCKEAEELGKLTYRAVCHELNFPEDTPSGYGFKSGGAVFPECEIVTVDSGWEKVSSACNEIINSFKAIVDGLFVSEDAREIKADLIQGMDGTFGHYEIKATIPSESRRISLTCETSAVNNEEQKTA